MQTAISIFYASIQMTHLSNDSFIIMIYAIEHLQNGLSTDW